jgi:hypothetical protein
MTISAAYALYQERANAPRIFNEGDAFLDVAGGNQRPRAGR